MKDTSNEIIKQLGIKREDELEKIKWSDLDNYQKLQNVKVAEKGTPLFVRLDVEEEINYIKGLMK